MKTRLCMTVVLGFLATAGLMGATPDDSQSDATLEARGQQVSPAPGQQKPPEPGQQKPTDPGQQKPPEPGQQKPTDPGQQIPPAPGQQTPPSAGQQIPPGTGQQSPPTVQPVPSAPGQQLPPASQIAQCKPGSGMQEVRGKFLRQGGELYAPLRVSAPQCAAACLHEAQCAGATYHPQSQTCYMKSYYSDPTLYDHREWITYMKPSQRFLDYANAFLNRGNDLAAYRAGDAGTCKAACSCQSSCVGYTFHAPSQSCYLKNQGADRRPYPGVGWISGLKG